MKIEFNNVKAVVLGNSTKENEAYQSLRRSMKVLAPGVFYVPAYKEYRKTKGRKGWDGRTNILKENGEFPTGLIPTVVGKLWKEYKISPTLVDNRKTIDFTPNDVSVELRGYQVESFNKGITNNIFGIWWPRGVFKLATGSGKTELAVSMYEYNPRPSLFIVNRKSLAVQTVDRFQEKYGWDCGRVFDKYHELDMNSHVVVATVQALMSRLGEKDLANYLLTTEQVFFDECHAICASVAKGNTFVKISNLLENAFFRWGLTATPFMKDNYSNWLLAGATGEILHEVSSDRLIKEKHLVPPTIKILEAPKVFKCPNRWPDAYDVGIVLNSGRTKLLVEELKQAPKPAIVLVKDLAHLRIIKEECNRQRIRSETLQGKDDSDARKEILEDFEKKFDVLITTLFSEGFDYPNLRTVAIASGGKSKVKTIQQVGRGLRNAEGKTSVLIIDFMDRSCKTLEKHSKERMKTYNETFSK